MKELYLLFTGCALLACTEHVLSQITPWEAIEQMQKGINLGNTLEPPKEGDWNNPAAKEVYFDYYKEAGFACVRVPVRWDEHTGNVSPYTIQGSWLDRVEQVLDWGLDRDLFIIVNAHHDNWIKDNYSDPDMRARFDSIWSQIALRFKDKPEKLIFEILNEPHGLTKSQNDEMHQRVLSIIRKTNPTRLVIFQGHEWANSDQLLTAAIPDDDYLIGSFHSYDPWPFGLEGTGSFGTTAQISALRSKFQGVKNWSDDTGIPVFLGEFGCNHAADYNSRMKHYRTFVNLAGDFGFAFCVWDDGGNFRILERASGRWDEAKDILIHSSSEAPANINATLYQDTIVNVSWTNMLPSYDSLYVQRRISNGEYVTIASFETDTNSFNDVNPAANRYYYYRIIAYYNSGEKYYSHSIMIFMPVYIPSVRGFFLGAPAKIPGTVEAENFDTGGEGLSYHDTYPSNITGVYRPYEAVDIYDRLGDGYHIGNANPGEWYEYTVDVEEAGEYIINIFLASEEGGGSFLLKIGELESDTLIAFSSGSPLYTEAVTTIMELATGQQVMRFTVISLPEFNFDKIVFEQKTPVSGILVVHSGAITVLQDQSDDLVFSYRHDISPRIIQVYDITGSLVYSLDHPQNNAIISSSSMPSGTYIFRALMKDGVYTGKIIIQ